MILKTPHKYGTAKLTICVPAYKRTCELRACVVSIISQFNEADFNLIIMLNGASQEVEYLVDQLIQEEPRIGVYRLAHNIAERIFMVPLFDIEAKSIIVFGDDDIIERGFAKQLCDQIDGCDVIIVNHDIYSCDLNKRLVRSFMSDVNWSEAETADQVARGFGHRIQFISCICINLNRFKLKTLPQNHPLDEFGFRYSYLIYSRLFELSNPRVKFISEPLVIQRGNNVKSSEVDVKRIINCFLLGPTLLIRCLRHDGCTIRCAIKMAGLHIRFMVVHHASEVLAYRDARRVDIIKCFTIYHLLCVSFWLKIIPLLIVPRASIRFLKKCRNSFAN
jgi:glycosyltransferase involved in cell wall biosynthesis